VEAFRAATVLSGMGTAANTESAPEEERGSETISMGSPVRRHGGREGGVGRAGAGARGAATREGQESTTRGCVVGLASHAQGGREETGQQHELRRNSPSWGCSKVGGGRGGACVT
jgi:hypothetical protein